MFNNSIKHKNPISAITFASLEEDFYQSSHARQYSGRIQTMDHAEL